MSEPLPIFDDLAGRVLSAFLRYGSKLRNLTGGSRYVQLAETSCADWVDSLPSMTDDDLTVLANAGAFGLGRRADDLIIEAMAGTPVRLPAAECLSDATARLARAAFDGFDQIYAVIGWKQWSELLDVDEFASAAYVGADALPWRGCQAKRWLDVLWLPHSGLPSANGDRRCFMWNRHAVAHGHAPEVRTSITWNADRAAHLIEHRLMQGASLVDPMGVVEIPCMES